MNRGTASLLDAMSPPAEGGAGESSAHSRAAPGRARPIAGNLAVFDPGWLFLIAGSALLAATVIIPAQEDLAHARWLGKRAAAVLDHREQRLERYREYLAAVDDQEPSVVLSLAASQLNKVPLDRSPLPGTQAWDPKGGSAMVYPALEPPPAVLPAEPAKVDSILARWARGGESRLWLIAAGGLCLLLGLLPAARQA